MSTTLSAFLNTAEDEISPGQFSTYQKYCHETWESVRTGDPPEWESMETVTDEYIRIIVKRISETILECPFQREGLRETLAKDSHFGHHSEESLNRTIDLALRLWLVVNIRDKEYSPGAHSIQWNDGISLQTFIAQQFPKPRMLRDLNERMFDFVLPDNFTMVKLKWYSDIKVDWTDDLSEDLNLDRDERILKVFPLKHYVNELRKGEDVE
jgi:hypothetical protein